VFLRQTEAVSADVVSCEIDQGQAKVVMHYRNRTQSTIVLSYDLVIMRNTSARRSMSGAEPLTGRHIAGIILAAGDSKEEVIALVVPAKVLVAKATVEYVSYERYQSKHEMKTPNQAVQHNDPSCHESCLRTPRASRGRG
jgi:uncharacterized membrane protein YebE (DUF533 family)